MPTHKPESSLKVDDIKLNHFFVQTNADFSLPLKEGD